jgi:hypothetical protein
MPTINGFHTYSTPHVKSEKTREMTEPCLAQCTENNGQELELIVWQ